MSTPRFPGSDTKYLGDGDSYGPLPDHGFTNLKCVFHTTETKGMPSFGNGGTAPHYVYDATNKTWYVWTDVDVRVGTLKGHGTNHCNDDSIQVEILGYSDGNHSPWVGDFDDTDYAELARFFRWTIDECGVAAEVTVEPSGGWQYGTSSPYRMTTDEWHAFSGLTAHGAAPGNTHWDTGVLSLGRIHNEALEGEDMDTLYVIGNEYQTYEEVSWLLYQLGGGVINVNKNSAQVEPVLNKTNVRLVTAYDFELIALKLDMNAKEFDRLMDEGLYRFGKEIAKLRKLTYEG